MLSILCLDIQCICRKKNESLPRKSCAVRGRQELQAVGGTCGRVGEAGGAVLSVWALGAQPLIQQSLLQRVAVCAHLQQLQVAPQQKHLSPKSPPAASFW